MKRRDKPRGDHDFDLAPDAESPPFTVRMAGARKWGLWLLLAAGVMGLGAGASLAAWGLGVAGACRTTGVVLAWLAVLPLTVGLHLVQRRREWTFAADSVEYESRGLVGNRSWSEPLGSYTGVLRRTRPTSIAGIIVGPHVLFLKHTSSKRRWVKLFVSKSEGACREAQARYAEMLALPALVEAEDGAGERVDDWPGRPLRDIANEVLLRPRPNIGIPPGSSLIVQRGQDFVALTADPSGLGMLRKLLGAELPLWLGVPAQLLLQMTFLVLAVGTGRVFLGAVAATATAITYAVVRLRREELVVSASEVRKRWRHPWGTSAGRAVATDKVLDVCMRKDKRNLRGTTVEIVARDRTLAFGVGIKRPELEWVRDLVVAVVAGSAPSLPPAPPSGAPPPQ